MTSSHRLFAGSLALLLLLTGCAGYRVGNISGREVQGVKTVYVPMAKNESISTDTQAIVTGAIVRQFDNDGTLETSTSAKADSQLDIRIVDVRLDPLRSTQQNVLITAEYQVEIIAAITFTNFRTGKKVLVNERISGTSSFYVQQDVQEGKRQAIPQAAENLAYNVVKRITEGW